MCNFVKNKTHNIIETVTVAESTTEVETIDDLSPTKDSTSQQKKVTTAHQEKRPSSPKEKGTSSPHEKVGLYILAIY